MKKDAYVLVVDDDKISVSIMSEILTSGGYSTDSCYNGEDALERIKHRDYDLVLLDVNLGKGQDGYETCMAIRKENSDLPVILVTASQDDESINKGFSSGSSDYIKKPVSRYELLARVYKTINFSRSEKRNLQLIYNLSKDLETAYNIQTAMLPKWAKLESRIMFSSHYEAFDAVGGDVFDRIKLSEDLYVVYMGDVSGHGVQAALLMTAIRSLVNFMVESDRLNLDLPLLVTKLNERLSLDLFIFDNYLTLLIGVVDLQKGVFSYLNAGHPPIVVIDLITGKPRTVRSSGSLPLGWRPDFTYTAEDLGTLPLSDNEIVLLFSDGIYECVDINEHEFGINGLLEALKDHIQVDSCISLPYRIKQYLLENRYDISHDDFSLLTFQPRCLAEPELSACPNQDKQAIHYMTTLKAALREVGETALEIEKLVLNWKHDKVLAAKVELIVDEYLNNIIKYGYRFPGDAEIVIELNYVNNNLIIRFWDKGIEWTPESSEYNSNHPYDFEQDIYNVEGKGVRIIMSLSDKFKRTRYDMLNETSVMLQL